MEAGVENYEQAKELDAQFRKTLCIIKQYIPYITNKHHIYCYRIWLEKLSLVDSTQKKLRNLYLLELKRQIQKGILEAPFIVLPPTGQLTNLMEFQWHCKSAVCSEEAIASLNSLNSVDQHPTPIFHTPCVNLYGLQMPERVDYNYNKYLAFPLCCPPQQTFTAQLPFDIKKKKLNSTLPAKDNTPLIQKFATKNFTKEDDSSWCDVSDISTITSAATAYASGDSYRNDLHERKSLLLDEFTVSKMVELIKKLQKENQEIYSRILKEGRSEKSVAQQAGDNRKISDTSTDSLCGEVACLRKRLMELQEIKRTLELQSSRGQDSLDILELELKATQAKNSELQSNVIILENKLKESEHMKQKEIAAVKRKIEESHQKEVQLSKELYRQEIMKMQSIYQKKMVEKQHEHSVQIEEIKNSYETDIMNLKQSYQGMLDKREQQIRHLEETVQQQCSKMEEEVKFIQEHLKNTTSAIDNRCYVEKIKALENCVIKLDKLFKKSEKEYQKQICKLKKRIKLCNKANQLLLQSQKLDVMVDGGGERQKKLNSLISGLENHYKSLLDSVLEQTLATKLKDEAVITDLRERLLKLQN